MSCHEHGHSDPFHCVDDRVDEEWHLICLNQFPHVFEIVTETLAAHVEHLAASVITTRGSRPGEGLLCAVHPSPRTRQKLIQVDPNLPHPGQETGTISRHFMIIDGQD